MELELPFGDGAAGELASRRLGHLREIVGDDSDALIRLAAAFSNLAAIYAAPEEELARVVERGEGKPPRSARRMLRRLLEHEWEHVLELRSRLGG